MIAAERERQKAKWDAEHDDEHVDGSLAMVAAILAVYHTDAHVDPPGDVQFDPTDPWVLITKHAGFPTYRLAVAGALIAAEIDRIRRRDGDVDGDAPSALAEQVGGGHYKNLPIQPVEYIQRNQLGFCEGNVVKYVTRHRQKGGRQDIEKAIHFLQLLLEIEYPEG